MKKCLICHKRSGKRFCLYYQNYLCSICCGQKRKEQIDCPKDCPYLKTAQDYLKEKIAINLIKFDGEFNKNLRKELIKLKNHRLKDLKEEEILEVLKIFIEKLRLATKGLIYEPKIVDIRKQLIYETIENLIKNSNYEKETLLSFLKIEEKILKEIKEKEENYFKVFSLLS